MLNKSSQIERFIDIHWNKLGCVCMWMWHKCLCRSSLSWKQHCWMMSRTGISCKRMTSHRYPCPRAPPAFRDEHCTETVPRADCRVRLFLSSHMHKEQLPALIYYKCCIVDDFHYRLYCIAMHVSTSACAVICGFSSLRAVSKRLF